MRSFRQFAALGLLLAPLAVAGPAVPAHAGGGAGLTLTATLDRLADPDPRLPAGTRHTVFVTVTDDPGEASLRRIRVGVADLDPADFAVSCDAGPNGEMSLELHQSLHCTADFAAEVGLRTIVVTATAQVPGLSPQAGSSTLHYTGFLPTPAPPAAAARAAVSVPEHHSSPLLPDNAKQADPRPSSKLPIMTPPLGSPAGGHAADPPAADPPAGDPPAADPPAANCPADGGATGACCGSTVGAAKAKGGGSGCCSGRVADSSCCAGAGAAGTADSSCCTGSSAAGTASSSCCTGTAESGDAAPAPCSPTSRSIQGLRAADPRPWGGLALTGTSAPLLGVVALMAASGGVGLVWFGRRRAARR